MHRLSSCQHSLLDWFICYNQWIYIDISSSPKYIVYILLLCVCVCVFIYIYIYIYILYYPKFIMRFCIAIVSCMSFGKCIMTHIHHCSVMQRIFTAPQNPLCSAYLSFFNSKPWKQLIFSLFSEFAFSKMSWSWTNTVLILSN